MDPATKGSSWALRVLCGRRKQRWFITFRTVILKLGSRFSNDSRPKPGNQREYDDNYLQFGSIESGDNN